VFLAATTGRNDNNNKAAENELQPISSKSVNPMEELARPLFRAATSAFIVTSLLFSNPLLPPPDAQAAPTAPIISKTATSIDIDLRSVPALTRKVIINREKLTNYLVDSIKSFKPILDLLSDSDTVTVKPPQDIKGAINQALTKGDAQFIVNNEAVDIRVESVPGVIVIRVINPNIPRLPFLRDGTAALQFMDGFVDTAPKELENIAEGANAIKKFVVWGAPQQAPIQYKGSSLDYFLTSKFLWGGKEISLGGLGELTDGEVVLLSVTTSVVGAYSVSYAYYVKLQEDMVQKEAEKKEANAKKRKPKAPPDAKKKKEVVKTVEVEVKKEEEVPPKEPAAVVPKEGVLKEVPNEFVCEEEGKTKGRKRGAFKKLFKRGGSE
jgi:hypothetical protein